MPGYMYHIAAIKMVSGNKLHLVLRIKKKGVDSEGLTEEMTAEHRFPKFL